MRGVLAALVLLFGCTTIELKASEGQPSDELIALEQNYTPFTSLQASGLIKGSYQSEVYEFLIEISVTFSGKEGPDDFKIVIKDQVFLAPLYTITLQKGEIRHIDHSNEVVSSYRKEQFTWGDLINLPIKIDHLIGLMTTRLPDLFFKARMIQPGEYRQVGSRGIYQYKLVDQKIDTIVYSPVHTEKNITITYRGQHPDISHRAFPRSIEFGNPAENEKLTLIYHHVKIL